MLSVNQTSLQRQLNNVQYVEIRYLSKYYIVQRVHPVFDDNSIHISTSSKIGTHFLRYKVASINGCAHKFHLHCIQSWGKIGSNKCPLCRNRFSFIQNGQRRYKVKEKNQANEDNLSTNALFDLDELPCQICNSTDYSFVALLCDGCDGCFHTHCVGLDAVPDGDWFCDTCKHLNGSASNYGFRQRLSGRSNARRQPQKRQSYANRNNRYDLNDTQLISHNEPNPEWLQEEDQEWKPSENESESESKDENIKKNRKRKWNEIESDQDVIENATKRRKLNENNKKWICDICTFENNAKSVQCSMCETPKKNEELSVNDYFDGNRNQNKQKYSRSNPYRKHSKQWMTKIIGDDDILIDLLSNDGEDEDEDNKNKKVVIASTNSKNESESDDDDDYLEQKPKRSYKEKYKKLLAKSPKII